MVHAIHATRRYLFLLDPSSIAAYACMKTNNFDKILKEVITLGAFQWDARIKRNPPYFTSNLVGGVSSNLSILVACKLLRKVVLLSI